MLPILVIDDSASVIRLFSHLLQLTTHSARGVVHASSLEEALDHLPRGKFHLVFLDNRLPPHSTYHEPLRQVAELTDAPIILFTGSELDEICDGELPEAFAGYFPKHKLTKEFLEDFLAGYEDRS